MKIFKVADEKIAPNWYATEDKVSEVKSSQSEDRHVNLASDVTEDVLACECDRIEECASNGKTYHYNSAWDKVTVSHLKEYALANGMEIEKFKAFDPANEIEAATKSIVKTASAQASAQEDSAVEALKNVMGDPFHIEARSNTDHIKKANWQQVKAEDKLALEPVMESGVIPIRGGEDYFMNSLSSLAKNQNSITAPDAIEKLAESTEEDSGARLRRQKAEKEAAKVTNHKEWEGDQIKAMAENDIVSKGLVFPTEVMNAQPGLGSQMSSSGVYGKFDLKSLPEKTAGEMISEKNAAYKKSIQRPKEVIDWQSNNKAPSRSISNDFGSAIESLLKK